jgi:hypothetical protein
VASSPRQSDITPNFAFIGLTFNKSLVATVHYNEIYDILHHFDDILFDVNRVNSKCGSWKLSFSDEVESLDDTIKLQEAIKRVQL